jgi:hypothetical protein
MTIKDASCRVLGYIEETDNKVQVAKDAARRILGYYDPHTNRTVDAAHRLVSHGNMLASLIQRN